MPVAISRDPHPYPTPQTQNRPCGRQDGEFPDGVDVAGPAIPQLIAGVVLAQHGVGLLPQLG
jgi:hypothetical protein